MLTITAFSFKKNSKSLNRLKQHAFAVHYTESPERPVLMVVHLFIYLFSLLFQQTDVKYIYFFSYRYLEIIKM